MRQATTFNVLLHTILPCAPRTSFTFHMPTKITGSSTETTKNPAPDYFMIRCCLFVKQVRTHENTERICNAQEQQ